MPADNPSDPGLPAVDPPPAPRVVGELYVTRLDGAVFRFAGAHNATYNLLTHGDLAVHASLSGSARATHRYIVHVGAGSHVEFDEKDLKRVVAGGWVLDLHRLNLGDPADDPPGEAYLDAFAIVMPEDRSGSTGLLVDGTAGADPLAYQVMPPPST